MTEPKRTRRKHSTTRPMPERLALCHVASVSQWPLGKVKTATAAGERWTDCVLVLDDAIRLGGKYNSRRVRYDGRFYITYRSRRVYLVGELAWQVWDVVQHVYGIDKDSDAEHNKLLKGY